MSTQRVRWIAVAAALLAVTRTAGATDGHFLHGVGAINSAMGGVAVARSSSILGAFYTNPAGLANFSGTRMELGFELFRPDRTVSSSMGSFAGSTTSSSEFTPIPAFGWSRALKNTGVVVGVAGIGAGGFGVDYRTDPTNPILMPRPLGFGEVFSSFQLMKIIPAVAIRATSKLQVGFAANVDWASLAVDPMPIASPAVDPGPDGVPNTADDRAFYSRATDADGAFGFGVQAGVQYAVTPRISLGASYVSPQRFQKFAFDAVYENPNRADFNTPRTIKFGLDVPAVYGVGVAYTPSSRLTTGIDAKYITYASTRGFKASGFASDGAVRGFGWENIWSFATGVALRATKQFTTRAGYNYSGNPIPNDLTMFNMSAPAVVQHHATVGLGYEIAGGFGVDLAYYRAFKHSISGPFQSMAGAVPSSNVTSSLSESSFLIGFSYNPTAKP